MNFSDAMCNDSIMLEPRLMEYLNRKKIFSENDIDSVISLEKQYSITPDDKRRIKKFTKGKRNLYTRTRLKKDSHFIDPMGTSSGFKTMEDEFKNDPRFKKLQKKMQRQKNAQKHRHNYGNMTNNYDMYRQRTPYDYMDDDSRAVNDHRHSTGYSSSGYTTERMAPKKRQRRQTNQYRDDSYMLDTKNQESLYDNPNYLHHPKRRSNMTYHSRPRTSRNRRLGYSQMGEGELTNPYHSNSVKNIIGELNSYKNDVNDPFVRPADMDYSNNKVIPSVSSNRKRGNRNSYMSVPHMHRNGLRNIDMDNYVRYGVNSRASKSVGYENPAEHYFQYIDNDIQNPDHVVNDRGLPSRSYNRKTARPYRREIM